jgi:hypothetical protein
MCRVEAAWPEGDLSPELVLVDPNLAEAVRAQSPERVHPPRCNAKPDREPLPVSDWEAALRRIAEHSNGEFDELSPRYHMPKFGLATVTWTLAAFLSSDMRLYDWSTWIP